MRFRVAVILVCFVITVAALGFFYSSPIWSDTVVNYDNGNQGLSSSSNRGESSGKGGGLASANPIVAHQERPEPMKAIYITGWSAGSVKAMARLEGLIARTEINSVVIDIKDDTGRLSYLPRDPALIKIGSGEKRIADLDALLAELHKKNVYVIGRVSTFQDPYFVKKHPELAVIRKSDGGVWHDRKGLTWLDPGATEVWDYLALIARESHSRGFDEINFDYIRFPSDGNMKDIAYRFFNEASSTKPAQLKKFYQYIDNKLSVGTEDSPRGVSDVRGSPGGESSVNQPYIPHSADLFGMTTTAEDDMGIGQMSADALPYFDGVYPMIYPSHYGPEINGFTKPAAHPYEMVTYALKGAYDIASSTNQKYSKTVPWLQDFDLGATYDAAMVRKQIQATYDSGLTSWLLWDPGNHYTESALLKE